MAFYCKTTNYKEEERSLIHSKDFNLCQLPKQSENVSSYSRHRNSPQDYVWFYCKSRLHIYESSDANAYIYLRRKIILLSPQKTLGFLFLDLVFLNCWVLQSNTVWEDVQSSEPFVGRRGEERRARAKNWQFPHFPKFSKYRSYHPRPHYFRQNPRL